MKDDKYIVPYLQKGKLYSKDNELDTQFYTLVWLHYDSLWFNESYDSLWFSESYDSLPTERSQIQIAHYVTSCIKYKIAKDNW